MKTTLVKAFIAAGIFYWLVSSDRLDFRILLSSAFNSFHLLGMLVLLISLLAQAFRWWVLLKIQNITHPFLKILQLFWISHFLSSGLPGGAGGEIARGYYIARSTSTGRFAGVSTILLDRLLGLFAFLIMGIISSLFFFYQHELTPAIASIMGAILLLFAGGTTVALIFCSGPIRKPLLGYLPDKIRHPLESTLEAYAANRGTVFMCLLISFPVGILAMGAVQVASHIIGTPMTWGQLFIIAPLVFIAAVLPISPGGLGVTETAAAILFAQFGVQTGAAIMLMVRLWHLILKLPGGVMFIANKSNAPVE